MQEKTKQYIAVDQHSVLNGLYSNGGNFDLKNLNVINILIKKIHCRLYNK